MLSADGKKEAWAGLVLKVIVIRVRHNTMRPARRSGG